MEKAVRYSKQREKVLQLLTGTKSHPTAEWIYKNLKEDDDNISLATVYRNLKQLTQMGVIQSFETGDRIEHYDATVEPHYHFVCNDCKKVYDIDMECFSEINSNVEDKTGYKVKGHSLIFYGHCNDCQ